jgi:hypothetical protein
MTRVLWFIQPEDQRKGEVRVADLTGQVSGILNAELTLSSRFCFVHFCVAEVAHAR